MPNSEVKCLKPLSSKFDGRVPSELIKSCNEYIKVISLLTIILMYLSMPLGITAISTSELFSSLKIMFTSYPYKLGKIIGNFLGILNFKLH